VVWCDREVVTEDISDFEYSPMPKFPGPFKIFNVENEEALLRKFVSHVQVILISDSRYIASHAVTLFRCCRSCVRM
jgi:hypothetical protein